MTSSLRHNDVITVKILSFYKNFTNKRKEEKFIDVSEFKKRQINGIKLKGTSFLI